MNSFTYHNPVKVVFGLGTLKQAGEEAAKLGKRALVDSYGDASVAGTLAKLKGLLDAAKAFVADLVVGGRRRPSAPRSWPAWARACGTTSRSSIRSRMPTRRPRQTQRPPPTTLAATPVGGCSPTSWGNGHRRDRFSRRRHTT